MLNLSPGTVLPRGRIVLRCGCMFSGKTTGLIRHLLAEARNGRRVHLFGPALDTRFSRTAVVSHNGLSMSCTRVADAAALVAAGAGIEVIGIDEAQFFDSALPGVIQHLAASGITILMAGLDLDFRGQPFGPMPQLIAQAQEVLRLFAECAVCGAPADRTYRRSSAQDPILLGAGELYEARCTACFEQG